MKSSPIAGEGVLSTAWIDATDGGYVPMLAQWDRFVAGQSSAHLEQTCCWGEVRKVDGWWPSLLVVQKNGDIVAGAQVLVRRIRRWFKIGYIVRGPLIGNLPNEDAAAVGARLI